MKILVSGLIPVDSGKTTFSLSILSFFKSVGIDVFPHKPVAGHNAWYSYSTLLRSEELKALVGNDALKYYDETRLDINMINPFAVLLAPPDLEKLGYNVRLYKEIITNGLPVMIRLYDGNAVSHLVLEKFSELVTDSLVEKIESLSKVLKAIRVPKEKLNEIINYSPDISDISTQKILSRESNVLIESYNDALAPNYSSLNVDCLFIVSPGKVFLIDEFKKFITLFATQPWLIQGSSFIRYAKVSKVWKTELGTYKLENGLEDFLLGLAEKE
ncbi:hypothetical protein [Sulfolobus acidocaldarius]|uniref:Conserved protein n=4 Tax=Sulfolobus acidocaldarius TaxID=2285 RepID=Q4JCJ0_SULAC|nr:hypothetical protein [Sulfolobus acidocaldarius]AAY79489.1 conserved protein [Sulfolobus acidocaldarius DSM 639]AGE70038.1 hypothetical protein SacN8_00285 [Sulfolobus acidocaldarius N8]AGE72313.1 hypothetical protein SacRon12I_00285 [Sulfolobus acidocaldarius Ron12/I]ALU29535.1 hypothetical protein ATY89_05970 [Sulfolobus acidocaldarius]ALU32265.1 hypothetical protein ATZ20_08995 [Sulfolobus acidocaldarius]